MVYLSKKLNYIPSARTLAIKNHVAEFSSSVWKTSIYLTGNLLVYMGHSSSYGLPNSMSAISTNIHTLNQIKRADYSNLLEWKEGPLF